MSLDPLRWLLTYVLLAVCCIGCHAESQSLEGWSVGRWPSPNPRAISSFSDWAFHVSGPNSERRRQQQANEDWWASHAPLLAKLVARTDLPPGVLPNLVVLFDDTALKRQAPAELLITIMGRIAAAPMIDQIIPGPVRRPYTDAEMVEYAVTRLPASAHTDKRLAPAFAKLRADGRLSERALRALDQSAPPVKPVDEDPAKRDARLLAALARSPDTWTGADQESVRSHEPSSAARAKALTLAVSAALSFDEPSPPAAAFLPLLVLQRVDLYADHLSATDLERLSQAMPGAHHRTRALMAWLSLLHADADAVRKVLSRGAIAQATATILPNRDQATKIMARPRPARSELERLLELTPFAVAEIPALSAEESAALDRAIQRLPRSPNPPWTLEVCAVASLRWRSAAGERSGVLGGMSWLAIKEDAKEWPLLSAFGDYADLFAAPALQVVSREIPSAVLQSYTNPDMRARLAAYFPQAKAARAIVAETVAGTSQSAQAALVAGLDLLDPIPAELIGDRAALVAMLSRLAGARGGDPELGPTIQRLRLKLGDDPTAVARDIVAQIGAVAEPRWDEWHDALIAAAPGHDRLVVLRRALAASAEPAKDFLVWLLDLRCGRDPGGFPTQAYHDLFRRTDLLQVFSRLARAGARAKPFIGQLRDPLVLRGCHLGDPRTPDWERADLRQPILLVRVIATLDHLDWCAREGARK